VDRRLDTLQARSVVKPAVRNIQTRRCLALVKELRLAGRKEDARWLTSSCFKGSGRWLAGPGGIFYGRFAFQDSEQYQAALRRRFLLPVASFDVAAGSAVRSFCPCNKAPEVVNRVLHHLDCSAAQALYIRRHDATRDSLFNFLCNQSDHSAYKIMKEPVAAPTPPLWVPGQAPPSLITPPDYPPAPDTRGISAAERRRRQQADRAATGLPRADIGRFSAYARQYIDVVVVNPAARSYDGDELEEEAPLAAAAGATIEDFADEDVQETPFLHATILDFTARSAAVRHRENAKKAKYRDALGGAVDNEGYFVPFIVEATGRLSGASERFVRSLVDVTHDSLGLSTFRAQLAALMAIHGAKFALQRSRTLVRSQL
jgi:hypothetical protein